MLSLSQGAPTASDSEAQSHQFLTFVIGGETYGIDILRIQEIRGWSAVTRLPGAPSHMLGVLNLRGSIVPVVDLRIRFNLQQPQYTAATAIIVLAVNSPAGRRHFGVVVDGVSDVIDVRFNTVKPTPELGSRAAPAPVPSRTPGMYLL